MDVPGWTLALVIAGAATGSTTAYAEPRGTLQLQGGFQIAPTHGSEGITGYAPMPLVVGEAAVRVVAGVAVVAAWAAVTKTDDEAGGVSNPYVGLRRRFDSRWAIEIEVGTTVPLFDLTYGNRCDEPFDDPPHSQVYSGCRETERRDIESSMFRAALGRGYRDPWLWAIDWNNVVAQLRVIGETELGPVELETFGVAAFDRSSDKVIGAIGMSGELRPRCYGVGLTAAQVFGDSLLTQFAGHARWLRHDGPTTFEVRLDLPVPQPEHTQLSLGVARTF